MNFKNIKFKVEKHPAVEAEISGLEQPLQEILKSEYKKIENEGIGFVKVKLLRDKIFEIKSDELRSLFKYKKGRIIVIGVVFVKETQKIPKKIMKLAEKRLKEV